MHAEPLKTSSGLTMDGPLLISPCVFADDRGYFYESWNQSSLAALFHKHDQQCPTFVQDNHSRSSKAVLRGLHYQLAPHAQGKLVRCIVGEIFDVAVDLRRESKTLYQWVAARLSSDNHNQLWIPPGFAHGFLTLTENAEVLYKATDFWCRDSERSIRWNDPELEITWPEPPGFPRPFLSPKDAEAPLLMQEI